MHKNLSRRKFIKLKIRIMGLDMYLRKSHYIAAEYEHRNVTGSVGVAIAGKPVNIKFNRISEIIESVGYWRKANAIHKWFVDNCQDGQDDCRKAEVSEDQLRKLLSDCIAVKNNHSLSETLLPPSKGFFFGSTDLNAGYYQDIDDTIAIIETILNEKQEGEYLDIIYSSSW